MCIANQRPAVGIAAPFVLPPVLGPLRAGRSCSAVPTALSGKKTDRGVNVTPEKPVSTMPDGVTNSIS